jgi:LAO/AO transport system kinase
MRVADSTVVVLVPEAGDAVQVMKAGLLEIADVFVVNKADRDGALRMVSELEQMLHLRPPSPWAIPVLPTEAVRGTGVDAVLEALERHRTFVSSDTERAGRAAARRAADTIDIVDEEVRRRLEAGLIADPNGLGALLESVRQGAVDPYSAALRILGDDAALTNLVRERPR